MSLLTDMAASIGMGESEVRLIVATAPRRYKTYQIPKRTGGSRTIAQPSREVKGLQYYLIHSKLRLFPIHIAALAYREGRNIGDNARLHVRSKALLKLDFSDFFPSLRTTDWRSLLVRARPDWIDPRENAIYEHLLFWGRGGGSPLCLSIGAPSSPILSNILMYDIDQFIHQSARDANLIYSRYADDITISGEKRDQILKFEEIIRNHIRNVKSPRLAFNDEKRGFYVRGQKQMVTGLIITPEERISIGRERKRHISVCIHKVVMNEYDESHLLYTRGLIAFAQSVEPSFVTSMARKYGRAVMRKIMSGRAR